VLLGCPIYTTPDETINEEDTEFCRKRADPIRSVAMASSVAARACVTVALLASAGPGFFARSVAVAAPVRPTASSPRSAGEQSLSERRAVRGVAVDDIAANESAELREIRRFEEQVFPKSGALDAAGPGAAQTDEALPPTSLPGQWGGSGDVPSELRSPEPGPRADAANPPPDSEWLRSLKLPELPVRWDAQVLRYLDYFKNDPKGRQVMANWIRRGGRYRELFEKTLVREGLPRDLFYVAMVESGFDTGARSRVGAGGIWQFMPGAARAYGLEVSYWIDARRDPERAAEAAAHYLKDLYVRFGSWCLVFAAYNAGYGSVLRSITSYNTNDYWELTRHESGLPWESSLYVPKILAAAVVGHNLDAFGYADISPDASFAYEAVDVPAGTSLATVARAAGTKTEVIEALNPHLQRGRTPPDRGVTSVRLPPGTAVTYAASFDKPRAAADKLDTVVLRFGETLDDVGRDHGVSAREIRKLNGVRDTGELRGGMAILVPRRAPAAKDQRAAPADAAADDASPASEDSPIIVAVPDRAYSYEGRERVFYRTRDGDGLDEIADVFGVRPEDLVEWNNLDPDAKLHPRMVLQVFVRKDFDPAGVLLLDPNQVRVVTLGSEEFLELETARRGKKRLFYTAKPGDTLAKLGRRYGLTPGDLARINRFSYNTELHEGDRVVVYSPTGETPREVTMGMTPGKKRPERGSGTTSGTGARESALRVTREPAAAARASGARSSKQKLRVAVATGAALKPAPRSSSRPGSRSAVKPAARLPARAASKTATTTGGKKK
jgi:membrane-bound lytic murein transglycosylase D